MYQVILLRHGESLWNLEGRFTGWTDVDLSARGAEEACRAAARIRETGFTVDLAFTSVLRRAIRTLWIVLDELDLMYLPVCHSWRLNERHYGALQGLDKEETARKYGEAQVAAWRRSFSVRPPALTETDPRHPVFDPRYARLARGKLPATESLEDTLIRVVPYWHTRIVPEIRKGKRVLIAAHGNSLRALVKYLDGIPDDGITRLEIPTGIPMVYEFDSSLTPIRRYYLTEQEENPGEDRAAATEPVRPPGGS